MYQAANDMIHSNLQISYYSGWPKSEAVDPLRLFTFNFIIKLKLGNIICQNKHKHTHLFDDKKLPPCHKYLSTSFNDYGPFG